MVPKIYLRYVCVCVFVCLNLVWFESFNVSNILFFIFLVFIFLVFIFLLFLFIFIFPLLPPHPHPHPAPLLQTAISIVASHVHRVIDTPTFSMLSKTRPDLISSIMKRVKERDSVRRWDAQRQINEIKKLGEFFLSYISQ